MLVIHTGEIGGSLFVWCEESTEDAGPPATKETGPDPHPFGASGARLGDVLHSTPFGFNTLAEIGEVQKHL